MHNAMAIFSYPCSDRLYDVSEFIRLREMSGSFSFTSKFTDILAVFVIYTWDSFTHWHAQNKIQWFSRFGSPSICNCDSGFEHSESKSRKSLSPLDLQDLGLWNFIVADYLRLSAVYWMNAGMERGILSQMCFLEAISCFAIFSRVLHLGLNLRFSWRFFLFWFIFIPGCAPISIYFYISIPVTSP